MANRLRRILENLEQPLAPLKIPPGEDALKIAVVGKDQDRKRRDMSRGQRGTVANREAVRRLARNDSDAGRAQVEFGPTTREQRHEQPVRDRCGCRALNRWRSVLEIPSYLSDRSNSHDMRRAGREQYRSGRIASGGNDTDALLFCRGDTLLDDGRAAPG